MVCIQRFVDAGKNSLSALGREFGCSDTMRGSNVLSVDIDGLDNEIFELRTPGDLHQGRRWAFPVRRPAHPPAIAAANVGQPLRRFTSLAQSKGYSLVCYSGNAFYVRNDSIGSLEPKTDQEAYRDFLTRLSTAEREWLLLANNGLVPPFYRYCNPLLRRGDLPMPRGARRCSSPRPCPTSRSARCRHLRSFSGKEKASSPTQRFFAILASVVTFGLVIELIRRRKLREEYALLWVATTLGMIVLSTWYGLIERITHLIGAVTVTTTIFLFAFLFLLVISVHITTVLSRLTVQVRRMAQEMAVLEAGRAAMAKPDGSPGAGDRSEAP